MVKILFWKDNKKKRQARRQATPTGKQKRNQPEKRDCKHFMEWLERSYPFYYDRTTHIVNEGNLSIVEAMELKRMGMKAGIPDYYMDYPNADYHGLRIEAKREHIKGEPKAQLTPAQKARGELLRQDGYCFEVCRGYQEMVDTFLLYIGNDPDMKLQSAPYTKRFKRIKGEINGA